MNSEIPLEELLRWRLARAEAEAPPAPRAARLLELAAPWWQIWPDRFQAAIQRLGQLPVANGNAMAEPHAARTGHPVPALIVLADNEVETSVRVLHFNVRNGQLHLRFHLHAEPALAEQEFEVTFLSEPNLQLMFSAPAAKSVGTEYRLSAVLSDADSQAWERLKVTDRFPFRLVLRASADDSSV